MYENKFKKDLFKTAYRTAYKTQRVRINYNSHIPNYEEKCFKPWNTDVKEAMKVYEAKSDIEGFKEWLKNNKDNYK